ncbi:MAG: thiamine-phosphate kinase [Planctomycetaceae bacterium]|nr:thiamine-phosphate kinase [Planctomycetaceae bacterium]
MIEHEFLDWLRQRLPKSDSSSTDDYQLQDDAARMHLAGDAIVTSDLLCEGVHFELKQMSAHQIGRKALAVNLSDLAAMAASPTAAVVSLLLSPSTDLNWAKDCYEGLLSLADQYGLQIVGGDTNRWSSGIVISVTAIGQSGTGGILSRSQAQVGDQIVVTGSLGGSLQGHHFRFTPRVHEAIELMEQFTLHSGMDISDGLTLDLSRLCEASKLGAELWLDQIPISAAAQAASEHSMKTPLEHALGDGEDFELLLTLPADEAARLTKLQPLEIPITPIGQIVAEQGLWTRAADGSKTAIAPRGYIH